MGIDFDHDKIRVAVSDLARTVLAEASLHLDVDHDAGTAMERAAELVTQVLDEANVDRDRVLGAGMALAGPVDHDRGALHPSPILSGWADLDAAAEVERHIGIPVHLDNDANLGALAEVTLGAGRNVSTAAYVQMSSGIGAGLIVEGRPYHGHRGTAGRDRSHARRRAAAPSAAAATAAASRPSPRARRCWSCCAPATATTSRWRA